MEKPPVNKTESQESAEPIPTEEEVKQVFEQLIGSETFEEVRKLEDEEGLYLWEVKVPDVDPENMGGVVEYNYMRKGRYEQGSSVKTAVTATFYDESEIPIGGDDLAELIDGYWKLKN